MSLENILELPQNSLIKKVEETTNNFFKYFGLLEYENIEKILSPQIHYTKDTLKYKKEFEQVLGQYSELEDITIHLVEKGIKHTMQSRPTYDSLFKKRKNREYIITINNGEKKSGGILVKDLNRNQKIGVFPHEIGHILDSENRNKLQLIGMGLSYILPTPNKKIEHRVDKIAINHGFGKPLISFTYLAFEGNKTSEKYKKIKEKSYYTPKQLQKLHNNYKRKKQMRIEFEKHNQTTYDIKPLKHSA